MNRTRIVTVVLACLAVVGAASAGRAALAGTVLAGRAAPAACGVTHRLLPTCGAWWGSTPTPRRDTIETESGRPLDVLHYFNTSAGFPTAAQMADETAGGKQRWLFENWKPNLGGPRAFSWAATAAGANDAQLDAEAAALRRYIATTGKPLFLALYHEPEDNVVDTAGSGNTPADYVAMWRHVLTRLTTVDGVPRDKLVTVLIYMGWGGQTGRVDALTGKLFADALDPGEAYVDWYAEDPYDKGGCPHLADFAAMTDSVAGRPAGSSWPGWYTWVSAAHPRVVDARRLAVGEWGVIECPTDPAAKARVFDSVLPALRPGGPRHAFGMVVYWNNTLAQDYHVDTSATTLAAWKTTSADPYLNQPHTAGAGA